MANHYHKHDPRTPTDIAADEAWTKLKATRYEHIVCVTCKRSFQRIDFGSAAHVYFCGAPLETPNAPQS